MDSLQWKLDSPVGPLYLVASWIGLEGVHWQKQKTRMAPHLRGDEKPAVILRQATEQLEEYFRGERRSFDIPLSTRGTEFQKKVWKILSQIPYGKTFSYTEVAVKIANAKAVRAVGSANGKNPLSIIVPCHRVIAADGSLGGYAGGLDRKGKLLQLEKADLSSLF